MESEISSLLGKFFDSYSHKLIDSKFTSYFISLFLASKKLTIANEKNILNTKRLQPIFDKNEPPENAGVNETKSGRKNQSRWIGFFGWFSLY